MRNQKAARLIAQAPEASRLPASYTSNSRQEAAMLAHCQAFTASYLSNYPSRPTPYLAPRCGT